MVLLILGDYDSVNKNLVIILLSKSKLSNVKININKKDTNILNIKKGITRKILNLKNFDETKIKIKLSTKSKTLIQTKKLNLSNVLDNVCVVNCDSTLGFEKKLWNKLNNTTGNYIIHCGDQIYNDKIFKKYHRKKYISSKDLSKLDDEIFQNYYNQFNRYKNILANNLNLMIPDDHDMVDNTFESKHCLEPKFKLLAKIFKKYYTKIQLDLRLKKDSVYYLSDKKNSSLYMLNYQIDLTKDLLKKYNFNDKIQEYKNIILISRKSLLSSKTNIFNQYIFSENSTVLNNIDYLLGKIIDSNKKLYIFCGDDHSCKKSIITKDNKDICTIITCGPINTVPELFKNTIFLNTQLKNLKIKNKLYELANSFIKLNYSHDKLKITEIIEKKNILYYLADNIVNLYNLM